jgi:hypothetical protein
MNRMNLEKIRQIEGRIQKNRLKLQTEKDQKKKTILRLKIGIDDLRLKIEKLLD